MPVLGEWLRRDIQHCRFKDYDLTFAFYSKFPSWGCPSKPIYSSAYVLNPFRSLFPYPIHLLPFQSLKSYDFVKISKLNKHKKYPFHFGIYKCNFSCPNLNFSPEKDSQNLCSPFETNVHNFEVMFNSQNTCSSPNVLDQILRFYSQNSSNCTWNKSSDTSLQSINALLTFMRGKPHKFIQNFIKFTYQRIFILNCHMYLILIVFLHSALMLSSWWRDKISWDLCVDFHSLLVRA